MNASRLKRVLPQIGYVLAVALGGLGVAMEIQRLPLVTAGLLFFGLLVIGALIHVHRLPRIFLVAMGILLILYAFLGRGGAYLGVPPLFVGEICLILGVITFVLGAGFQSLPKVPLVWLLVAFMCLGVIRTVPYIEIYGIDALRDAAIWGYAIFGLIIASCLLRTGWIERALRAYGAVLPWFLVWVPVAYMLYRTPALIPTYPVSGVRILVFKAGDMLVHLAGVAGFMLVGLYGLHRRRQTRTWLKEWPLWGLWMVGFVLTATRNRGGMLAAVTALGALLILRPTTRWGRVALLGILLVSLGLMFEASFRTGSQRQISLEQFKENIVSIYSDEAREGLVSTREWRLEWWGEIINYTVKGPYFWTGKGFGMTLFTDINPGAERARLRSPHNGHMTILARMGVPGFVLWVLLNGFFAVGLVKGYFKARAAGHEFWARLDVWLLAYWMAFMVNASFDVYLEGPQGGIWFWAVFGTGIAALRVQHLLFVRPRVGDVQSAGPPPTREKMAITG